MKDDPSKSRDVRVTAGDLSSKGERLAVEIVAVKDRKMAFGWRVLLFAVIYVGIVFTVAVVATALTPGPPF